MEVFKWVSSANILHHKLNLLNLSQIMSVEIKGNRNQGDPNTTKRSRLRGRPKKKREAVLGDKNGSHRGELEEKRYSLRKRKRVKILDDNGAKLEFEQPKAKKTQSVDDGLKTGENGAEREIKKTKENQENSSPILKQNWRSRCGRKRKYFGEQSIRQGATKRERKRFNIISKAFEDLRNVLPKEKVNKDAKLSKFATLTLATRYISFLANALQSKDKMETLGNELNDDVVFRCESPLQSDSGCSSGPGLSEDELYTGDFTDILCAEEENVDGTTYFYDEFMPHSSEGSLASCGNGMDEIR